MFDISEKLITEQSDEIYGVNTINGGDSAWKHLSLIGGEEVVSLSRAKVYVFSDSVLCLGKMSENPLSNIAWEDKLTWFKSSSEYRALDRIDGEPMEFEWNIFPGFTTLQLWHKVQGFLSKMSVQPEDFTGRIIFMSMFNDISLEFKEKNQECKSSAQLETRKAKRFSPGRWSFFGPGSEKKWYSALECKPQGEWDRVAELMMLKLGESRHPVFRSNSEKAGHPVFRATSPSSRGTLKSKCVGKLSIHFCAFVPTSVMKTPTLLTDDPAQDDPLQKYQERVDKLSQQNRVIKFCTDAGFLTTVDVGRYFMTKDTEEFSQFTESVACRGYTLPRGEKSSDPEGWIRGNPEIGPVLEVTTSYLRGKNRVEVRIESVNKDNSHSWVRISHGLNKLVTDLSNNRENDNNEQETSEMQFEDCALKSNVLAFASPSKAKAKPQRRTSASSSTKTVPIGERTWTDIEPQVYSLSDYSVSKKLSNLLRHGRLPREDDGAIEF